ncbi:Ribonucleases P/MRP protein subunit pop1 [Rhodotorula kratochvilovae]
MPPKRPSEAAPTGAQLKRQRMRDQRSITVQGHEGRKGGSAGSGNAGLPAVLEVEKFAQARVFEISAMQRAMKAAKEAGTQRAFQSLPRHLRRRAASHNIRRLPTRLRERARAEVPKDAAKPKRVSRKMLGRHRTRPGLKAEMFKKRQEGKMWLETHVWHAKRMHMTEIWGHRLAEKPTAKAFRASYRASQHGALVHDASYYQYFELEGPFEDLAKLLQIVCDPAAPLPTSKRYSAGARECTTNVYDSAQTFPHGLLGPATFIWQPAPAPPASPAASTSSAPAAAPTRTLLIRVHPAVARDAALSFEHALKELRLGLCVALRRYQGEFLTFEVTGRRATEVVKAVLRPVKGTDDATNEAWRKLDPAAGPGGVPGGMVLGLEVYDPRLSFPPKLDKQSSPSDPSNPLVPSPTLASLPSFWSPSHRASIRTPRYKKRDLDARRSHHLVPGTRLSPLAQDDRIPILLSQRTLGTGDSALHGWTLTLPSGWGMPFWSSLVFCTPRVGALRERAHQSYEAGAARFPEDYVGVAGFEEHEVRRESEERGYWERRPPAKRPSYDKLGTRAPWRVEMGEVLAQAWRRGAGAAEGGDGGDAKEPFLVPHAIAKAILAHAGAPPPAMEEDLTASPRARAKLEEQLSREWGALGAASSSPSSAALLPHAMVRVKVVPCMRGVPEDLGLVYELDEETARAVRAKVDRAEKGKGREVRATGEFDGAEDLCDPPLPEQVIGRITTGSFSLSSGRGGGVAVVSLYRLLALSQRGPGLDRLVLFRNRDSETYRAATVQLMV